MWAWILVGCTANTLALLAIALRDAAKPLRALSWVVMGLVLPVLVPLAYWVLSRPLRLQSSLLGVNTLKGGLSQETSEPVSPPSPCSGQTFCAGGAERPLAETAKFALDSYSSLELALQRAVTHWTGQPPLAGEVRLFFAGTDTYESLLRALSQAYRSIQIEYYIFRDDAIGRQITEVLSRQSQAGVRVQFLRDGLGSRAFPRAQVNRLQRSGVACRNFFPLRFPWLQPTLNHRDHTKIVVIDGDLAFTGGMNVGNEYMGAKLGPWRDTHLALRGPASRELATVFSAHWQMATREPEFSSSRTDPSPATLRRDRLAQARWAREWGPDRWQTHSLAHGEWSAELAQVPHPSASSGSDPSIWYPAVIQVVHSGPRAPVQSIRELYFLCLTLAQRRVDITTPYFAPNVDLVMAMKTAVARGVKVRLLVPEKPDHRLIDLASRTYYEELLEAGVEVFVYQRGLLHAKGMTVDERLAVLGAANLDMRSFRLNFEVCTVLYSEAVAKRLGEQFQTDLQGAIPLPMENLRNRGPAVRVAQRAARLLIPLL